MSEWGLFALSVTVVVAVVLLAVSLVIPIVVCLKKVHRLGERLVTWGEET